MSNNTNRRALPWRGWLIAGVALIAALGGAGRALAQNPVQWQGNPRAAIERAQEQMLPLMVWVWESTETVGRHGEDDELRDAQEKAFRDPTVVALAQSRFVPLRLMRNSRSDEALAELGLPTGYGLYIAIVSPDRKLIDRIGIEDVASPGALAARLIAASRKYVDGLYEKDLKPVITDPNASKEDVRRAVQTTWRLKILSADKDIVGLLKRPDITPVERRKLYSLLAAMGTPACVHALLDAAESDKDAAQALSRADAAALETLVNELPAGDGTEPTARQLIAYRATVFVARSGQPRPDRFWTDSPPEKCASELQRLKDRAESVMEYAREREGRGK